MNRKQKIFREKILIVMMFATVISVTLWTIRSLNLQEDLALLQIDLLPVVLEANKCLSEGGVVQDIFLAVQSGENPEDVYVCSDQNITSVTYPDLSKLSKRNLKYNYARCVGGELGSGNCWSVARSGKKVLICDVKKKRCELN